jgi:multidrug resistance protein MdtO
LGQLSIVPLSKDIRVVIEQTSSLRERINTNLDKVRLLADSVLFEFGPSRQQDLALRRQIVRWQAEVRMLFLMEIAWLKYSLQLPGFELPEALREAQQEFSQTLAQTLEGMADRIEGGPPKENLNFEDAMKYLERKIQSCFSTGSSELLAAHLQTLQSLSSRMGSLTISLANEIRINSFPLKHET